MDKRKRKLIIGIIIFVITISFTFTNRNVLIGDLLNSGRTILTFNSLNDVSNDKIKQNISETTNFNSEDIKIVYANGKLEVELEFIESELRDEINNSLMNEFGEDIEYIGSMSIGEMKRSINFYLTWIVLVIFLFLSIVIIGRNVWTSRKAKFDYM